MAANVELVIKAIDETQAGLKSAEGGLASLEETALKTDFILEQEMISLREQLNTLIDLFPQLGAGAKEALDKDILQTADDYRFVLAELEGKIRAVSGELDRSTETTKLDAAAKKEAAAAAREFAQEQKRIEKETGKINKGIMQFIKGIAGFATLYTVGTKLVDVISQWAEELRKAWIEEAKLADKTGELARKEEELYAVQRKLNALQAAKLYGDYATSVEHLTDMYKLGIIQSELTKEKQEELGLVLEWSTMVTKDLAGNTLTYDEVLEALGITIDKVEDKSQRLSSTYAEIAIAQGRVSLTADAWEDRMREAAAAAREAADPIANMADDLASAEEKAEGVRDAIAAFWDGVDRDIAGTILDQIKDIEFVLAGGDILQNITQMLQDALRAGFDPAVVNELLKATFVEAIALDVKLGEIEPAEGAADVAALLGISEESAAQLIADIISGAVDLVSEQSVLDALGGQISDPLTAAFEEIQSQASIMSGGIIAEMSNVLTQGIEPMNAELAKSIEYFLTLGGFPKVTITIETEGGGGDTMP